MKRLVLIGLLVLVVIIPALVFAGDVYSPKVKATFYNEAKYTSPGLTGAKGIATITYSSSEHKWTISMSFSGLLKNHDYIFQISAQDQLMKRIDISVRSDKTGKINTLRTLNNLDSYDDAGLGGFKNEPYSQYDIDNGFFGYTILRFIDLSGESGGIVLADLDPETDPYLNEYLSYYPNASMVMRAREDGYRGSLIFY